MITAQGQNRAAMSIMVFADELEIPLERADDTRTEQLREELSRDSARFWVNIYNYLGYAECAEKSRKLHEFEKGSRPGPAAFIEAQSRLVSTVLKPQSEMCCPEYANEVMGDDWRRKLHPGNLARASKQTLATREKMFNRLFSHVSGILERSNEFKTVKGIVWETLVYAWAVNEREGMIKTVMDRFYQEDDDFAHPSASVAKARADGPLTECLMVLFGLLKSTQSHADLTDSIAVKGIVNAVMTMARVEASVDIVRMTALGMSRGSVRKGNGILDGDGKPMTGLASLLPSLVNDGEVERLQADGRRLEQECLENLAFFWPVLLDGLGKDPKDLVEGAKKTDKRISATITKAINKKAISTAIGGRNKADLTPKGTRGLYISTAGVCVEFTQEVYGELLSVDDAVGTSEVPTKTVVSINFAGGVAVPCEIPSELLASMNFTQGDRTSSEVKVTVSLTDSIKTPAGAKVKIDIGNGVNAATICSIATAPANTKGGGTTSSTGNSTSTAAVNSNNGGQYLGKVAASRSDSNGAGPGGNGSGAGATGAARAHPDTATSTFKATDSNGQHPSVGGDTKIASDVAKQESPGASGSSTSKKRQTPDVSDEGDDGSENRKRQKRAEDNTAKM
eukprot:g5943.t1